LSISPSSLRLRASWAVVYVSFSALLALAWVIRSMWARPDVQWQSQLLFVDDIERVLTDGVTLGSFWVGVGGDHALTGYRWFQYLNAALFGLSQHVETVAYGALVLVLSVALGLSMIRQIERAGAGALPRLLVFLVPVILCSLAAAGSGGMEIGQFTGMTVIVLLALAIPSSMKLGLYSWLAYVLGPVLTLLVLGSYAVPVALALVVLLAVQLARPRLSAEVATKLRHLTFSLAGSAVFWVALMLSSGANSSSSGTTGLSQQIGGDWLFPVRYMLGGLASNVTNSSTLEFITVGNSFVYFAAGLVLLLIVLSGVLAMRVAAASDLLVPSFLVLFGFALGLTLMAGRNAGAFWLLSPWYGFLFRLQLVGALWLLILGLTGVGQGARVPPWARIVAYGGCAALGGAMSVYLISNLAQWTRQPAERAYFQSLQNATLFPQELVVVGAGLTQLQIPLDASRHAVDVLARNQLSVYRDPKGLVRKSTAFEENRGVATNGLLEDGWASQIVRGVVMDPACDRVRLRINPVQRAVPKLSGRKSSVRLDSSFTQGETIALGDRLVVRTLYPKGDFPTFSLRFARTFNLKALGLLADQRDLSARVTVGCL
jgi:hypothetical protein